MEIPSSVKDSTNMAKECSSQVKEDMFVDKTPSSCLPKEVIAKSDTDNMLALAQQKFDTMRQQRRSTLRRGDLGLRKGSSSIGLSLLGGNDHVHSENIKGNQLLSSLLYLSLMMHKVEDMKKVLELRDYKAYKEWQRLFGSLHSPQFHIQERRIQNERVKKIYKRKCHYKDQYEEVKALLDKAHNSLEELTVTHSKLTEENQESNLRLQEKLDNEKDCAVAQKEIDILRNYLSEKEHSIEKLKQENNKLQSDLNVLETTRSKNLEQIKEHAIKTAMDEEKIQHLEIVIDELKDEVRNLQQKIASLEKDKKHEMDKYTAEVESHEVTKKDLDGKAAATNDLYKQTQDLLREANDEIKNLQEDHMEKAANMKQDMTDMSKEIEVLRAKLQITENELAKTRVDLEGSTESLSSALSTLKTEASNYSNLKALIDSKDNNIENLNQTIRDLEVNRSKDKTEYLYSSKKWEADRLNFVEQISFMEKQLSEPVEKASVSNTNKIQTLDTLCSPTSKENICDQSFQNVSKCCTKDPSSFEDLDTKNIKFEKKGKPKPHLCDQKVTGQDQLEEETINNDANRQSRTTFKQIFKSEEPLEDLNSPVADNDQKDEDVLMKDEEDPVVPEVVEAEQLDLNENRSITKSDLTNDFERDISSKSESSTIKSDVSMQAVPADSDQEDPDSDTPSTEDIKAAAESMVTETLNNAITGVSLT